MSEPTPSGPAADITIMAGSDALPEGTRLGEFEINRVLGIGGFGIVYLATDHALQRRVAIKEYMPSSLAGRGTGAQVSLRSSGHAETYMIGLRSFVNEARLLARFDHPALVKVYRFWEQHGTAYMVMPYYEGVTLKDMRLRAAQPPSEAWLRGVLAPVMGALEALHAEQVYHRDVSPDNIMLLGPQGEGAPVLLDLGAARRVIGNKTQTLTAILKPSYAPIEQYAENPNLKQGPWTDLYALASVVYFCIAGHPPSPATSRAVHDDNRPMKAVGAAVAAAMGEQYSPEFLEAIDWALAVRPADRPQSVQEFRAALDHGRPASAAYAPTAIMPRAADEATRIVTPAAPAAPASAAPPAPAAAATPAVAPASPPAANPARHGRTAALVLGVLALTGLGVGIGWFFGDRRDEPAAAAGIAAPAPVPAVAASAGPPAPVNEPAVAPAAATPAAATASAAAPPGPPAVAAPAATTALPSTDAAKTLAQVAVAATPVKDDKAKDDKAKDDKSKDDKSKPTPRAAREGREPGVSTPAGATATSARTPPAQAAPPVPQPEPVAQALPTPREVCGRRVFIALYNCMKEQCEKPQYLQHPECRKLREMEESRNRRDVN